MHSSMLELIPGHPYLTSRWLTAFRSAANFSTTSVDCPTWSFMDTHHWIRRAPS